MGPRESQPRHLDPLFHGRSAGPAGAAAHAPNRRVSSRPNPPREAGTRRAARVRSQEARGNPACISGLDGVATGYRRARRAVSRLHLSPGANEWCEYRVGRDPDDTTPATHREGRPELCGGTRTSGHADGGSDFRVTPSRRQGNRPSALYSSGDHQTDAELRGLVACRKSVRDGLRPEDGGARIHSRCSARAIAWRG